MLVKRFRSLVQPTGQSNTLGEPMKASEAVDGGIYNLPARGSYPAAKGAVCNGWNYSGEWLLFVVYDEQHTRKIRQIMPTEEISKPVE